MLDVRVFGLCEGVRLKYMGTQNDLFPPCSHSRISFVGRLSRVVSCSLDFATGRFFYRVSSCRRCCHWLTALRLLGCRVFVFSAVAI